MTKSLQLLVLSAMLSAPLISAGAQSGDTARVTDSSKAQPLPKVETKAAKVPPRGFTERRGRGIGVFFTPEQVERSHAKTPSELLQHLSFVTLVAIPGGHGVRFANSMRGGMAMSRMKYGKPTDDCQPIIFIDGQRAPGTEMDDLLMSEILAVEVYATPGMVPQQFVSGAAVGCGTILVWTPQGKSLSP